MRVERSLKLSVASLPAADAASYASFRNAISKDREQSFTIAGVRPVKPPVIPTATPSVTAVSLHKDGLAAFNKHDYAGAVDLFKKATEADPKVQDGFVDLGRGLHEMGKYAEAVEAFTRQVEVAPFHENAYAWRAYAQEELKHWKEAEADLQKQIEIAPFQAWSYERLGKWRQNQGRPVEAAELLSRAAAIEPKIASRWVDLADAQADAARPDEARKSLEQATSLSRESWLTLRAATIYHSLHDLEAAGRLAAEAAPLVASRLAKLTSDKLDRDDIVWMTRLVDAWSYVGEAALEAGDLAKAEKYLQAAWQLGFVPRAGWALGTLREKQGRLADAVDLWAMAGEVPSGPALLPRDRQARIRTATTKLPELPAVVRLPQQTPAGSPEDRAYDARVQKARDHLQQLRTVVLSGQPIADFGEEVLLLVRGDGRVEKVVDESLKSKAAFDRQLAQLPAIQLDLPRPDENAYKAIRSGLLACSRASNCALVLDVPGLGSLSPPVGPVSSQKATARSASRTSSRPPTPPSSTARR